MKTTDKRQNQAGRRAWVNRGCAAAAAVLMASSVGAAGSSDPTATIRVYNYAAVSNAVLKDAEKETARIFTAAGINTAWLDCSGSRVPPRSGLTQAGEVTTPCSASIGGDIVLRILSRSSPASTAFRDTMFGFAEGGFVASVFYARLQDVADGVYGNRSAISLILGDVIAHEMGHLLLGTNSHSRTGIMNGKWDPEYLRLAAEGFQTFSTKQSAVMRATVLRRQHENAQP